MLDPGASIGDDPHRAGNAAVSRRAEPDPGAAVDDQEAADGVPPDRLLQRIQFVAGQEFVSTFPDHRRLGDMRVTIEGRKILGHRRKALNRHAVPPIGTVVHDPAYAGMRTGNDRMPWMKLE